MEVPCSVAVPSVAENFREQSVLPSTYLTPTRRRSDKGSFVNRMTSYLILLRVSNVADQFLLFVMILRELLTQRQSRIVLLPYGGGGERRGKTGRRWGIWLPLLFPLSFRFAPATKPKCFFCFLRAAVKTDYTAHLTFAVADSTRQSLLLHKADFRCAPTSTFKNCA